MIKENKNLESTSKSRKEGDYLKDLQEVEEQKEEFDHEEHKEH